MRKIWKGTEAFLYGHDEDQGAFVSVFVKKLYGKKAERSRFVEEFWKSSDIRRSLNWAVLSRIILNREACTVSCFADCTRLPPFK